MHVIVIKYNSYIKLFHRLIIQDHYSLRFVRRYKVGKDYK